MLSHNDLKKGIDFILNNQPHEVLDSSLVFKGRGSSVVQTKIKNLITGSIVSKTFHAGEELEEAEIEKIKKEKWGASLEKIKNLDFDFESQGLIDEAVFEVEVERDENRIPFPEEDLKKALKRHKNIKTREKVFQVSQSIKEAERAGDKKKAKVFLEKFQKLSARLGE